MGSNTSELHEVLYWLLAKHKLSEADFSRLANIPRATVNRLVSGKTPDPRASTLNAMAEHFNVSVDQLLGREPIYDNKLFTAEQSIVPILDVDNLGKYGQLINQETVSMANKYIAIDAAKKNLGAFAVKVAGDAMAPQFQEGSILIVIPDMEINNRDFVICFLDKEKKTLFRQFFLDGCFKVLKSVNSIFPSRVLSPDDVILGKIVEVRNLYE